MVFDFDRDCLVLDFRPRPHVRAGQRRYLLWPVWLWRVVAPRRRVRHLDPLQRACIGLARAGVNRAEEVAARLDVHPELVDFVRQQAIERGWLDGYGLPTRAGVDALEHDGDADLDLVAGHVFADAWTGELWPRFVETLKPAELDFARGEFPALVFQSNGGRRTQSAFTVRTSPVTVPPAPTPAEIVRSVRRHHQDAQRRGDAQVATGSLPAAEIDRVTLIDARPRTAFVVTMVYLPAGEDAAVDWYACDPVLPGHSPRLRGRIEAAADADEHLRREVDSLVTRTVHADLAAQRRWFDAVDLKARSAVTAQLGLSETHSAHGALVGMFSALEEVRALDERCPERKRREVMRAGSKALEAVFAALAAQYPLGDVWHRVYVRRRDHQTGESFLAQQRDQAINEAVYARALRDVGFRAPIPRSFLRIPAGQIRAVADYGNTWRLRPLVTATALRAQSQPDHPLCRAAAGEPRLLETIEAIARDGGRGGHHGGPPVSREAAESQVARVVDAVAALLPPGGRDAPNSSDEEAT